MTKSCFNCTNFVVWDGVCIKQPTHKRIKPHIYGCGDWVKRVNYTIY